MIAVTAHAMAGERDRLLSYKADNWQMQLNINNLFNKKYYSKAMFLGGMPGEERNAKLSFSYTL